MAEDFHVKGRVSVDGSSLSRAGESIKLGLSRAFGSVAGSFRGALLSVFSAGAMTALIGNNLRKALETSTAASKMGVSPEEYSTLARLAEQTGVSVEDIAKKYINAKESGGAFAKQVQEGMKELLEDGLIPSTKQTEAMAEAMLKLADFATKASVAIGDVIANVAKTANKGGGGVFGWLVQSAKDTGNILLGWTQERIADAVEMVGGKAELLREDALRNKLKGYGIDPDAETTTADKPKPLGAFELAKKTVADDAAKQFRKDAFGGSEKIGASNVSSLTQIGGYMTNGIQSQSGQEYQLKLINRQMSELVATVKRGQM